MKHDKSLTHTYAQVRTFCKILQDVRNVKVIINKAKNLQGRECGDGGGYMSNPMCEVLLDYTLLATTSVQERTRDPGKMHIHITNCHPVVWEFKD